MSALLVALGTIFVAELGDKSQLLSMAFATRHRPWPVLLGIAVASTVLMGASVAVGTLLQNALPTDAIAVVGGVLFLVFAVLSLRDDEDGEEEAAPRGRVTVVTVASSFAVGELGDKTMIAAIALAARGHPVGTWIGATIGMIAANALAVLIGNRAGARLPRHWLRRFAAVVFAGFGVALIVTGLTG